MTSLQSGIIIVYGLLSLAGFLWSLHQAVKRKNVAGSPGLFVLYGACVIGDMSVFGFFWTLVALLFLFINDWILFLITISVFWVVRSVGETIYWFNQQFSTIIRNPPKNFPAYKIFKSDAVWWIHQIFWQCITVFSVVSTLYLVKIWFNR